MYSFENIKKIATDTRDYTKKQLEHLKTKIVEEINLKCDVEINELIDMCKILEYTKNEIKRIEKAEVEEKEKEKKEKEVDNNVNA